MSNSIYISEGAAMSELGLVSVSFRKKTPKEILEAMMTAGLDCIEWGSDIHAPANDSDKLNNIVSLQNEYGIRCCSYGTYFRLGESSSEELDLYIKAAKLLGTNIIRIWCGSKGSEKYSEAEKRCLFNAAACAAKAAEKSDVILCLECHNGTFTDELDSALEILRATNSQSLQMYWQPNQYKKAEDNLLYAKEIANYVKTVHVFNWNGCMRLPLEKAIDIWKSYVKLIGVDKTFLLEFMPDNRLRSLPKEAEALKKILNMGK